MYDNPETDMRFVRINDVNTAVGAAVRLMMSEPAFSGLGFGEWARVIDGQVARGHCGFVVDAYSQIVGFAGWALAPEAKAEAWANHGLMLSDADCREGDCLIVNAWLAKDSTVNRFLLKTFRSIGVSKKTAYFRRNYRGGVTRVVRLPVNKFVSRHIARDSGRASALGVSLATTALAARIEERAR